MWQSAAWRRAAALVIVPAALALAAGCEEATEPERRAQVHAIRLEVDTFVVTIDEAQAVTGAPIVIPPGDVGLIAQFLDADGEIVPLELDEYRLEIASADTQVVTFTRHAAFAGTLTGVAEGATQLGACLYHIAQERCEFGDHTSPIVAVTVQAPPPPP